MAHFCVYNAKMPFERATQKKERIDLLLVQQKLESTRSRAQARILAGDVVVDDHRVDKPGSLVSPNAIIRLKSNACPYVSRGGLKLKAAIDQWPSNIQNAICIDIGASTGGFTDVLLKEGANTVYTIDVGYGQLDYSLRIDPRVKNHERTHILKAKLGTFFPAPTIAVIDVSFISLKKVLPGALIHLDSNANIYALIKPQFEVGKEHVGKGGIVRDPIARDNAVNSVIEFSCSLGLEMKGLMKSPITGADGNVEYLAMFVRNGPLPESPH